jgi:hypothetical protein
MDPITMFRICLLKHVSARCARKEMPREITKLGAVVSIYSVIDDVRNWRIINPMTPQNTKEGIWKRLYFIRLHLSTVRWWYSVLHLCCNCKEQMGPSEADIRSAVMETSSTLLCPKAHCRCHIKVPYYNILFPFSLLLRLDLPTGVSFHISRWN